MRCLNLGDFATKGQQFSEAVSFIMAKLEKSIVERVSLFESSKTALKVSEQSQIDSAVAFLIQHAQEVVSSGGNFDCVQGVVSIITNIFEVQLPTMANNCFDNFNLDLTKLVTEANQINDTAQSRLEKMCNCVDCVPNHPTKEESANAIACAFNAVITFSPDFVNHQAFLLFEKFNIDTLGDSELTGLQTCLSFVHIPDVIDSLRCQLDSCRFNNIPV